MLEDGLDPARRAQFRKGQERDVLLTTEQYLQWLTEMERWFPAPPPSDVKRYRRLLL